MGELRHVTPDLDRPNVAAFEPGQSRNHLFEAPCGVHKGGPTARRALFHDFREEGEVTLRADYYEAKARQFNVLVRSPLSLPPKLLAVSTSVPSRASSHLLNERGNLGYRVVLKRPSADSGLDQLFERLCEPVVTRCYVEIPDGIAAKIPPLLLCNGNAIWFESAVSLLYCLAHQPNMLKRRFCERHTSLAVCWSVILFKHLDGLPHWAPLPQCIIQQYFPKHISCTFVVFRSSEMHKKSAKVCPSCNYVFYFQNTTSSLVSSADRRHMPSARQLANNRRSNIGFVAVQGSVNSLCLAWIRERRHG